MTTETWCEVVVEFHAARRPINRPITKRWAAEAADPYAMRTLAHLPAAHIAGVQSYFINAFYEGGVVYWMPRFDFPSFLSHFAALRITHFFSVPPIYMALARHPAVRDQLAAVRVAYSGAAPLSKEMQAEASVRVGREGTFVMQTWGMSETTGDVTSLPVDQSDTTGSVGRLLPNMRMRYVPHVCLVSITRPLFLVVPLRPPSSLRS